MHRQDLAEMLPDYLRLRADLPVEDPHPLAVELAGNTRHARSLPEIAALLTGAPDDSTASLHRSVTSSDFAGVLGDSAAVATGVDWREQAEDLLACVHVLRTRKIQPVPMPIVDAGTLTEVSPSMAPIPLAVLSLDLTVEVSAPRLFAVVFNLSRALLIGDDIGLLSLVTRQLNSVAIAHEWQLMATLLDGASLTATTATGLDASSLGEAAAALRDSTTAGGTKSNAAPAVLIVPSAKEITAKILNLAADRAVRIVVNPWITEHSYLIPDPRLVPTLVKPVSRLGAEPTVMSTTTTTAGPDGGPVSYDGAMYKFEAWLGLSLANSSQVIRITAA